ncbi:hypothetical protein [Glutamicibacter sp. BSL13]
MNQQPSIRDLFAQHLGTINHPISVDLSADHDDVPSQPPALNGPELKQSIMQAIAQDGAKTDPAAQTQFQNEAFRQKVVEALTTTINKDGQ